MRARRHAGGGLRRGQHRADREPAAERFRKRHDIRLNADVLIGEEIAGAAHAGLHFVEGQQQAVFVAQRAQRLDETGRSRPHAALALHQFDQDTGGLRADGLLDGFEIAMRHLVETVHRRAEAFEIFRRAGRRQRRQRAAMEGALESDDAIAFGMPIGEVIVAHELDDAFHRLGAGITEEDEVGKAVLTQARRQPLAVRALEQVRHVPEPGRLLLKRFDQMRMRMTERIHRDARSEVEIAFAVG